MELVVSFLLNGYLPHCPESFPQQRWGVQGFEKLTQTILMFIEVYLGLQHKPDKIKLHPYIIFI
jgi:hypothetical protein